MFSSGAPRDSRSALCFLPKLVYGKPFTAVAGKRAQHFHRPRVLTARGRTRTPVPVREASLGGGYATAEGSADVHFRQDRAADRYSERVIAFFLRNPRAGQPL